MKVKPDTDPTRAEIAHDDERGRVLPFRPASTSRRQSSRGSPGAPIDDLDKYARADAHEDDYRHRMMVNIAAVVFVMVLAGIGVWIANSMAQIRKNEDCVLSGRRNCSPIDLPAARR
jgi:hypothetical protein